MANHNLKPYKAPQSDVFNLRAGAIHSRSDVLIIAGLGRLDEEHTAHTIVLKWNGSLPWYGVALNWSSGSCCATLDSRRLFCVVGIDGEFGVISGNDLSENHVGEGSLSAVTSSGRSLYTVGVAGRILRSLNGQSWERVTQAERVNNNLLEAVVAYTPDEVYAVGDEGTIVLLSPTAVERIDSPTNVVLSGICRGPDGLLYACGQKGIILRGRGYKWALVEQDETIEDLWDVCTFQDRLFFASTHFLYEWKDDALKTVNFDDDVPHTFCKLASAGNDTLLSVGQTDAFLYDGDEWARLI